MDRWIATGEKKEPVNKDSDTPAPTSRSHGYEEFLRLAAAAPATPTGPTEPLLELGEVVGGRYRVGRRIGEGAMGQVYLAEDLDLGRKAALKLSTGTSARAQRDRIELEARSLAKLSHPNVVTVYGVGLHGERMFIAMEYAQGGTSREWMKESRSPREVLDHFTAAGRGLLAAHCVGIVHGDFKPDNVLIAEQGRVVVADFGLAHASEVPRTHNDEGSPSGTRSRAVGTLAYAAPERRLGSRATPQSDLLALCVCLHEGLAGRRPEIDEVAGTVDCRPRPKGVPRRAWAAIVRGLHPDLSARWLRVDEVLDELAAARRPRVWPLLLGSALVAGAVGAWSGQPRSCDVRDELVQEIWSPRIGDALAQAHRQLDAPMVERTTASVNATLERYAEQWRSAREAVCLATRVEHSQSDALLDARMLCLDQQKATAERLVALLSVSDPGVVSEADAAVSGLVSPSHCVLNHDQPALPKDEAAAVLIENIEADLVEARALLLIDRAVDAAEILEPHLDSSAVAEHGPSAITLHGLYADALVSQGEFDEAWPHAHQALGRALGEGLLGRAAWAAGLVTRIAAAQPSTAGQVAAWSDVTAGLLRRNDEGELPMALLKTHEGKGAATRNDYESAEGAYREAFTMFTKLGRMDLAAHALGSLGGAQQDAGDYVGAQASYEEALLLATDALGEHHPRLGAILEGLAFVRRQQGPTPEAEDLLRRALELHRENLGPASSRAVGTMNNLGGHLIAQGRVEEAIEIYESALELLGAKGGDPGLRVNVTSNLGSALEHANRNEEAVVLRRRAVELLETLPFSDDKRAVALVNLSSLEQRLGNGARARALGEEGLELGRTAFANNDGVFTSLVVGVAAQALIAGDATRAFALLEAQRARVPSGANPTHGMYLSLRVEVLSALKREAEAREVATQCAAMFEALYGADHQRAVFCRGIASG